MFHSKIATMKCSSSVATRAKNMEKSSANVAASKPKVLHIKASPVKEPTPIKLQCPPAGQTIVLFSLNDNTKAIHNKENSTNKEHDRTLEEGLEESGYLSMHNSQIDDHHEEEEDGHIQEKPTETLLPSAAPQEDTQSPNHSPSKCQGRMNSSSPVSLVAASTPVDRPKRRDTQYPLLSSPSDHESDPNLPLVKFGLDVCKELRKSYLKNKRYDWTIVSKVAEGHLLDRVIGGPMGREYIDVFTSLLCRNMKSILTKILALLGDMDLISCKKVSRTWRRIIFEDTAAKTRCRQAEEALRESMSSLRERACGLTRDMAVSRVVLSCMQTLASSSTPTSSPSSSSSSSLSCRANRRTASSQKGSTSNSKCKRFEEYMQAASCLKQHESLRSCKRCGSPARHSAEAQRATCTHLDCQFDFCTKCQEAFHGSNPCRTVQPRPHFLTPKTNLILPGSALSKRNVKRL